MRKAFENGLSTLFYLMITADGIIDDRELALGDTMIKQEGIRQNAFYRRIEACSYCTPECLYRDCINSLKKCCRKVQIKSVAWMSLVARIDGHVSTKEAALLEIISSRELKLESELIAKAASKLAKQCKLELPQKACT